MESLQGWQIYRGPSASSDQTPFISDDCQSYCITVPYGFYITQKGIITSKYHNITLKYNIMPWGLDASDFCQVSYSVNNTYWTMVQEFDMTYNSIEVIDTQQLNTDADNNNISIRFETIGNPLSDWCFIDEVYVYGIKITTHPAIAPTTTISTTISIPGTIIKATTKQNTEGTVVDVRITNSTSAKEQDVNIEQDGKTRIRFETRFVIWISVLVLILIIISSYIYSKCIRINDFYRLGALVFASLHGVDALSDVLFGINIANQSDYPSEILKASLAASIIFIILPAAITLYQLYKAMNKWKNNDDVSQWLSEHATLLYIVSVITGSSFTGVELYSSNIFNLQHFDIPLGKLQLLQFKTKRVYSTVLLENIPYLFN